MATKPTETVTFEPTGTAVVTIPSGKQAAGWQPGEKPPAQYRNWLDRTFGRLYNYVIDGALSGNHTIAGTLGVTGAITGDQGASIKFPATPAPAIAVRDASNRARFMVDRLGLPAGQWSSYQQPWAGAALPSEWASQVILGTPTVSIVDPSSSAPWRHASIVVPDTSSIKVYGPSIVRLANDLAVTMDMAVHMSITGNAPEFEFGLEIAATGERVAILCHSNSTVQAITDVSDSTMTGAWTAGSVNHFKLEVEGSSISGLTAGTCRLRTFVNGVTSTPLTFSGLPANNSVRPYISATTIAGSAGTVRVGGVRVQWITALANQY